MEEKSQIKTYDYRTIRINRQLETMAVNAYENLGWELTGSNFNGGVFVTSSFKRDKTIANKKNLLLLQEQVEIMLQDIEILHIKKKRAGFIPALTTGIIGILTFGGGMAMVLELGGSVGLSIGIILGLIGMGICAFGWPIFKHINAKKIAQFDTLIGNKYNKLLDLCKQTKE